MATQAKDLRQQGIAAAKAGNKDEARRLLQQAIRLEPGSEPAWLWLASVARDDNERLFCLRKVLEINPANEMARKVFADMQGAPGATQETTPAIRPIAGLKLQQPTPPFLQEPPPVPMPSPERIAEAQRQAEMVVREYLAPHDSGARWVHKTRSRAGERDIIVLRAQVAAAIVAFLVVFGVGGVLFVLNNPDARAILFAPTWTPTFTPTFTPTSTPGLTPTPSVTPALTHTPSPTVPPALPTYDPYFPPRPTDAYPRIESVQLQNAVALVEQGGFATALPTIEAEVLAVQDLFNPAPFYFEALALAGSGSFDRALRALESAEGKLTPQNTRQFKPVIDAAYAVVYVHMAQDAFERGQDAQVRDYLAEVQTRAESAIEGDPRNPDPYLALAHRYRLSGDYGQAIQVLDDALARPELQTNTNLLVEKGEVYFAQRAYDLAAYEAFVALYLDAATEPAHLLRIRTALAQDEPGLAVLYAQAYLFYYPGSALGYKLLGDARIAEGNFELALAAYTQGLAGDEEDDVIAQTFVARAQLYSRQGRYDAALDDLTEALEITDEDDIRALRMQAAFAAGNFAMALEDADALLGREVVPDSDINLLRARILIDGAESGDQDAFRSAAGLLSGLTDLAPDERAAANEYFARVQYELGNYESALQAVDAALVNDETGSRHYLRGLILEAQGEDRAAAREYEWVLTWSQIYPFSFRVDAETRLQALTE